MLAYTLRRLFQSVFVLLVVGLVAFSMFRFIGDPIDNLRGQEATQEDIDRPRNTLGLTDLFVVHYGAFLGKSLQGNFGIRYRNGRPVAEFLTERAPATLVLTAVSGASALVGGVIRRGGVVSNQIMSLSMLGVSLIGLFSVELNWLPRLGRGKTAGLDGWSAGCLTKSRLKALLLTAIGQGLCRLARPGMREVLWPDYIRSARARWLSDRSVYFRYVPNNTLVPVMIMSGQKMGAIIAFAIITEPVFQWSGAGLLFINAIQFADIPVMAAYLMLISVMFVAINLVVLDLLYCTIDPRLRVGVGLMGHS